MNIYEIRNAGREYCQTEGSEHYKAVDKLEPIDLIVAKGLAEDFCLANIIKYAARFKKTQNLNDLRKISDYSHILCGVKIAKKTESEIKEKQEVKKVGAKRIRCLDGYCSNHFVKTFDDSFRCRLCFRFGSDINECKFRTSEEIEEAK
jgi:Protein of unknwon function (DUF3310).